MFPSASAFSSGHGLFKDGPFMRQCHCLFLSSSAGHDAPHLEDFMLYRTQIIVCQPNKREVLLQAIAQGATAGIPGMTSQQARPDVTDDETIVILQSWDSKQAADEFQAALPPEKAQMFQSLMVSRAMCWHDEALAV